MKSLSSALFCLLLALSPLTAQAITPVFSKQQSNSKHFIFMIKFIFIVMAIIEYYKKQ